MDLSDLIERNSAFTPDKAAIRFEGETLSYSAFCARIAQTARALKSEFGVSRGDRVAILIYGFCSREFVKTRLVKRMQKFGVSDGLHGRERQARMVFDPVRQVVLGSGACLWWSWNRLDLGHHERIYNLGASRFKLRYGSFKVGNDHCPL